ncbi:MAG: DUF1073 domain-containing protein [Rickettsiales bacterium]
MNDKNLIESARGVLLNSLSAFTGFFSPNDTIGSQQVAQADTMLDGLRWYLITNNRQLLSQSYAEIGIVQTLIDQPVDDAFRNEINIHTDQLSDDEIDKLKNYTKRNHVLEELSQGLKWARLFGGGAVIVINGDSHDKKLDIKSIKEGSKLSFRAVDMWELYRTDIIEQGGTKLEEDPEYYTYYGMRIHNSRVFPLKGKRAPSLLRPNLRGWGMSELERVVGSLNSYIKNKSVIFELLDEAKIDVYKIDGFNNSLMTTDGTTKVAERIQNANMIKNYQNAITMDKGDEYDQKQVTFSGLAEILTQIRQGVAADLRMPLTKLFGISSAGFNSGEDDIENYNSMIESEIRAKAKYVKNSKFNRTMQAYQSGLAQVEEAKKSLNKDHLLPVEIDDKAPAVPPLGDGSNDYTVKSSAGDGDSLKP